MEGEKSSVIFIYENISISSVTHLSASDNWRSDYLPPGGTLAGLKGHNCIGLPKELLFPLQTSKCSTWRQIITAPIV